MLLIALQGTLSLCQAFAGSFPCQGHHNWYPLSLLGGHTNSASSIQIKVMSTCSYFPTGEYVKQMHQSPKGILLTTTRPGLRQSKGESGVHNDRVCIPLPWGRARLCPGLVAGTWWVERMVGLARDRLAQLGRDLQGILVSSFRARTQGTLTSGWYFFLLFFRQLKHPSFQESKLLLHFPFLKLPSKFSCYRRGRDTKRHADPY